MFHLVNNSSVSQLELATFIKPVSYIAVFHLLLGWNTCIQLSLLYSYLVFCVALLHAVPSACDNVTCTLCCISQRKSHGIDTLPYGVNALNDIK